uniref:Cytochrome P450 n=1 Tax=Leersia perrieri TaxID=77586 RepID=A0A0D9WXS3_9ORYZ
MEIKLLSSRPQPWPPLLQFAAAVLILLLPLLYLLRFRAGARKGKDGASAAGNLPPGPPSQLPVLGNLLQIGRRPHRYFQAMARRYGPVVQVQLGSVRAVVVHSPEAAKDVLRTNDVYCCSRPASPGKDVDEYYLLFHPPGPRMLSYNFLDVGFSPYSAYWREMKKILIVELTSMRRVQSFSYARVAEVSRLIDALAATPPGVPFDLSSALTTLSDRIIGTVAFGRVYGSSQWSSERSGFHEVLNETNLMLGSFNFEDFFPSSGLARWADTFTGIARRRRRIFRRIDRFFDAVIDKHLDPGRLAAGVQEDMVDTMVKMWREQQGKGFALTRENIKAVLMNIFAGGIDTTAIITTWVMSELMRKPRVMQKAQAEVRNIITNKARVDEEDVRNLKYIKMVIKETFRLHPPVTLLLPRQTMQSCNIGGYSVLSGTRIFINVWAMGRDPSIWNSPDEFFPERFEDKNVDFRGSHFELLPFGSGRRICPGITMGVATVELVVANLLYCFDWELPKGGMKEEDFDMEEEGQLTFRKKVPLYIVPVRKYGL